MEEKAGKAGRHRKWGKAPDGNCNGTITKSELSQATLMAGKSQ